MTPAATMDRYSAAAANAVEAMIVKNYTAAEAEGEQRGRDQQERRLQGFPDRRYHRGRLKDHPALLTDNCRKVLLVIRS